MQQQRTASTGFQPDDVLRLEHGAALVVGDIMLDCYLTGTVDRVSPEAPVPVLIAGGERTVLGGAANVAANVAALGARALLFGIYGSDERGRQLETMCTGAGVELSPELQRTDVATIVKQRVVSGNQQLLRIDWERYVPTSAVETANVRQRLVQLLTAAQINVVILSDYAKGTITPELARTVISEARRHGVPVVVDPKGNDLAQYSGATVVKPNISEARTFAGLVPDAGTEDLADAIHRQAEIGNVVISMASDGVVLFPSSGAAQAFRSHVVEVADVSGAGDTMISTMAAALGTGFSVARAVELGNVAAGISCTHFGTSVVGSAELLRHVTHAGTSTQSPHIVRNWDTLRELVDLRRRAGERIVFANGCFDLLHGGHVALLEEARRQGDVLVVGLNSDDSVRRLKGDSRPLQSVADRLRVMAAIRFVDYVTDFEADTPLDLILKLEPDVLVKGGDYTPEQVVGAEEAQAWNGRVHIVTLIEGLSTTALVSTGR